jgi:hypothetical protein
MATVKDFVRKTPSEAPGPAHPCDAPGLSPIEFLRACMHDTRLPLSVRMDAAARLLPLTESIRRPVRISEVKIVIGGINPQDSFAPAPDAPSEAHDGKIVNSQSNSADRSYSHRPFLTTPGPSFIEKTLERMSLSEIIQIVANTPDHLLPVCTICNHPTVYPCSVAPQPPGVPVEPVEPSSLPCVIRHTVH